MVPGGVVPGPGGVVPGLGGSVPGGGAWSWRGWYPGMH